MPARVGLQAPHLSTRAPSSVWHPEQQHDYLYHLTGMCVLGGGLDQAEQLDSQELWLRCSAQSWGNQAVQVKWDGKLGCS